MNGKIFSHVNQVNLLVTFFTFEQYKRLQQPGVFLRPRLSDTFKSYGFGLLGRFGHATIWTTKQNKYLLVTD